VTPDYRVYAFKDGKPVDVTGTPECPVPKELIIAMNATKAICLLLATMLDKDWRWNENYPRDIVRAAADLVAKAMKMGEEVER